MTNESMLPGAQAKMIGVDVGGTFTDVVATSDAGILTAKVATRAERTEGSVLEGARELGVDHARAFNHASTHGLNAVITRRLPKVAFLTTEGHRDMLDSANVWRPVEALTDPHWRRSFGDAARPLVPRYLRRGLRERMASTGETLIPLDEAHLREQLTILVDCDVAGVAVCLLHAYAYPQHEQRVRELVSEVLGPVPCSISSEVSPLAKEYERASTTVIDVFMKILYGDYTQRLIHGLDDLGFTGDLNFANCAAQLMRAEIAMEKPFNIVFSGPAAGTVASARFGELIGTRQLLCADVGGTSCDLSLVPDGAPLLNTTFELEHDLLVNALAIEVSSIGAGGGSLVTISAAGELQVGPGSAGADPGPACYDRGGTVPTMTDACLLMGILDPNGFAGGRMKLDPSLAHEAFQALDTSLSYDQRINYTFNVGLNNIAEGVTNLAVRHGVDPRDFSLVAYGAAGPMLVPSVLPLVQVRDVLVPPHPGLFSALGLLSSDQVYAESQTSYIVLDSPDATTRIADIYEQMERKLADRFADRAGELEFVRSFDGRLLGQNFDTPFVPMAAGEVTDEAVAAMIAAFHDVYESRLGNRFQELPVEGVTYRVQVSLPSPKVEYPLVPERGDTPLAPVGTIQLEYLSAGEVLEAGEYVRAELCAGDSIAGPAVIREPTSTTFVPANATATVGRYGEVRIALNDR